MKLIFEETFLSRLDKQVDYIAKDNYRAAKRFKKEVIEAVKQIPKNPYQYRKSVYFDSILIRDMIFKGYTITFSIHKKQIEVFGFTKYQQNIID